MMFRIHRKAFLPPLRRPYILQARISFLLCAMGFTGQEARADSLASQVVTPDLPQLEPWLHVAHLFFLAIITFIIIRLVLSWRKSKKLNEKMVHYIQAVYDLQKPLEFIKGPLEEISKDDSINESHKSKIQLAIWSTSTIQRTINSLIEQEKSDKFFQSILNSAASKKVNLKEKIDAKITTYRQQKDSLNESGREAPLFNDYLTDQLFIEKLKTILKKNLEDTEFTVDVLCEKIGMSRTSLYHKVKTICNQAPADFIRQYRLERAKELLISRQYTVSEVAYKTGFSDVKYFRAIFKKQYKTNPSNFTKVR